MARSLPKTRKTGLSEPVPPRFTENPLVTWEAVPVAGFPEGHTNLYRARVPGGWLVSERFRESAGLTFVPDPLHTWGDHSQPG
mgnify:CR=1 FL=1|jgi:hypothetical protein